MVNDFELEDAARSAFESAMAFGVDLNAFMRLAKTVRAAEQQDKRRMDWLERKTVQVRDPLRHGSREMFWASPDVEEETTGLRQKIDRAMTSGA